MLVKIADRLHNMRTIHSIDKQEKKERIARETMEIYSPLADRMGMNRIRDELEDLSFEVLNPKARKLIKDRLDKIKENNLISFNSVADEFTKLLNENDLSATIYGREKTPFSLWRKMQSKRISLEQMTDIMGFRIILNDLGYFITNGIVFREDLKTIFLLQK